MFVKLKSTWPDFVFHQDYILRPLVELQNFINEYGHLPEIPTAEEIAENGIATGETILLLTKKVEELTLYIIQMNNEIKGLKNQINDK